MGVLRYKILRDLWGYKGRTIQVVLIIGIGAAAIGMILGTRNLIIPSMQAMWVEMNPAMINVFVGPPVTEDELLVLQQMDGVKEIEGLSNTTIEWRLHPGDEWKPGGLTARADYVNQRLNKIELVSGNWPKEKFLAVESGASSFFGIPADGQVYLKINSKEYLLNLGGTVYYQLAQPVNFGGTAQFYTTVDDYERMVGNRDFSQLLVAAPEYIEEALTDLADRMQNRLQDQGKGSGRLIVDPNKHFFQSQLDGIFLLLGILGLFSLGLGLLLVYNTINGIITSQVDQIGVMKAVGARRGQVLRLYLTQVLMYSVMATIFSVPIGVLGAWAITSWLVGGFGADPGEFQVSWTAVAVQVAIAFVAPLIAAFIPILGAARITVREAISTYGLSTNAGLIEKLGARTRFFPRSLLITISNTFRHKQRVFLLQIALVLSGLMFIMTVGVRDSAIYTIRDITFEILGADITLVFNEPQRIHYLEQLTLQHPEVESVEMWGFAGPTARPAGTEESEDDESVTLLGVPLPTRVYGYQLREGRWLDPKDEYAIVMTEQLAKDVGVGVGDWVTLQYGETNQQDWQLVGLIFDPLIPSMANVPRDVILRELGQVGNASSAWIKIKNGGLANEIAVAKSLRAFYEANGVEVSPQRGLFNLGGDSTIETANAFINQFNFLLVLLGIMAVMIGLVGSIALSGALSLSVLERNREIGVMRAIGASSGNVSRLFVGEGLILGWLSWMIAWPLSIPVSKAMVSALGAAFNLSLVYKYTPLGGFLWFIIITILAILASWLPARRASRLSVRETLVYQ